MKTAVDSEKIDTIDKFLAKVERRAYRMALLSTRQQADALDVVQDAMLKLVQYYNKRPANEWPLLFQRILQNRIMDWHREEAKRRRWFWQAVAKDDDDDDCDLLDDYNDQQVNDPAELLELSRDISKVLGILELLPIRQRQAFMLRAWEGFDVAETATVMECSEGSVKTHYFRALQVIKKDLQAG